MSKFDVAGEVVSSSVSTLYRHSVLVYAIGLLALSSVFSPSPAEEVSLEFDGLTVNANLETTEDEGLPGTVVLLIHGVMGHYGMEVIAASQRSLLENGRSSLAPNLSLGVDDRRGFYDCASPHRHIQDAALREIQFWIDWLKQRGTSNVILMAHSRGANQAMVYAASQIDPSVSHLVLLAPGIDDSKQSFEDRYGAIFDETLARAERARKDGRGNELMEGLDFWYCPQATITPNSFISYYGKDSRFRKIDRSFGAPPVRTLVLFGTEDEVVPGGHKEAEQLADGERVQLVVIEGAGHFFLDLNIEEAIEAMLEFIDT